jgi:hypothetical protein
VEVGQAWCEVVRVGSLARPHQKMLRSSYNETGAWRPAAVDGFATHTHTHTIINPYPANVENRVS